MACLALLSISIFGYVSELLADCPGLPSCHGAGGQGGPLHHQHWLDGRSRATLLLFCFPSNMLMTSIRGTQHKAFRFFFVLVTSYCGQLRLPESLSGLHDVSPASESGLHSMSWSSRSCGRNMQSLLSCFDHVLRRFCFCLFRQPRPQLLINPVVLAMRKPMHSILLVDWRTTPFFVSHFPF